MITDIQQLINACEQELHDREYHAHHADFITNEWKGISQWCQKKNYTEFSQDIGFQYCDEMIGAHIITKGMTHKQKLQLRAARMLVSYQKDGDFEFRSPRVERIYKGETGRLILQFFQHERNIGRSEKTLECRDIYLYPFNQFLLEHDLDFSCLDIDTIEEYFTSMGYELSCRHNSANHLRQLFHYLYDNGYTATDNALYVLKDQYRKQCKLPTTYTEEEISRVLSAVDRSSAIGKRDYLILLLAAQYGWRTGDIVSFKFSQINWDKNIISFDQGKTDIPVEYPLLSSVGNAVIDYLKHGRPQTDAPEIIVSAETSKHGTPLKPPTVHSIVSKYMRKANINHWKEKHSFLNFPLQKRIILNNKH